jgi:hypothetical protein
MQVQTPCVGHIVFVFEYVRTYIIASPSATRMDRDAHTIINNAYKGGTQVPKRYNKF